MQNKNESFDINKNRKKPIQLELFPNMIKAEIVNALSINPKNLYNKNNRRVELKDPKEIDPVDCNIW